MTETETTQYRSHRGNIENDKADYIAFWKEHFPNWPSAKYEMFYQNNPHGQADIQLARRKDDNKFFGTTALFPKRMRIDGQTVTASINGDLGVNKAYRNHGIAKQLTRDLVKTIDLSGFDFVYGTPNVISGKVTAASGYSFIGESCRMTKVLRSRPLLQRYLKSKFLSRLLSPIVDFVSAAYFKESREKRSEKFGYDIGTSFDHRYDSLWDEVSPYYPILGERTSEFLNWRFTNCPYKTFEVFALTDLKTEKLVGYVVYQVKDSI